MESCSSSIYEFDICESEFENSIPPFDGSPPSLDSVLRDLSDDDDTDIHTYAIHKQKEPKLTPGKASLTSSTKSYGPNHVENSLLQHGILQGISTQILSAKDRINAGIPTTLTTCSAGFIAIGTAHGIILTFDSAQALRWCSRECDYGAVSALSINLDGTRLLAGYERGAILMFDLPSGDVLRKMPDAHAPYTAVLHLRFADWPNLAFCSDSAGCVFSLAFNRRLGVRSYESKCIFSGARGEVCAIEPLINGHEELRSHLILAMTTLSKVIIICVRPRLKVIFTAMLPGPGNTLPVLAWQAQTTTLAFGRNKDIFMYQLTGKFNDFLVSQPIIYRKTLPKIIRGVHFLSNRAIGILDNEEVFTLYDVRLLAFRERLDLNKVGLVYASAHFKALATGGCVSAALACAGEHACYGSMSVCARRLLLLGINGVHTVTVRTANERLKYLKDTGKWPEVFKLATNSGSTDLAVQLINDFLLERLNREGLEAAIQCCIAFQLHSIISNEIWEKASEQESTEQMFFHIIEHHIQQRRIRYLSPSITQRLITYHENVGTLKQLEDVLPFLDVSCLDLHQLLSMSQKYQMYKIILWLNSSALQEYTTPLNELLPLLKTSLHARDLGNELLVYVSCCLAGRAYPKGELTSDLSKIARSQMLCYLLASPHSLLKALLAYDAHACVSMLELAFTESDFSGDLGQCRKHQVVQLLRDVSRESSESTDAVNAFICRLLLNNSLTTNRDEYVKVIDDWLFEPTNKKGESIPAYKEQLWLDLMVSKILNVTDDVLIRKAEQCRCFRVQEMIFERTEEYPRIFKCYLNDDYRKKDVFKYIRKHSASTQREIRQQIIENLNALIDLDRVETFDIVTEYYPELVVPITEKLYDRPVELLQLLRAAIDKSCPISSHLAQVAYDAGDCELGARILECAGDLAGALTFLLRTNESNDQTVDLSPSSTQQAAALCARAAEPATLLSSITDPKLLMRLFRATLADCSYQLVLYQKTFKILSGDLHQKLQKDLKRAKRGVYFPANSRAGCQLHRSMDCIPLSRSAESNSKKSNGIDLPQLNGSKKNPEDFSEFDSRRFDNMTPLTFKTSQKFNSKS